jgi:S1-C subfamily serine protease
MKILAAIALFSLGLFAELVPVGFHSLDSKKIPADLRAVLSKVQGSVGKVELRVNKDVSKEVKKGAVYTSGTGYVVEPGDVLRTASHVIKAWKENRDKLDLFFVPDGKEGILIEKIIKDDTDTDLATLGIKKQENFLALSNQKLELGTPLIQIGYALGFENKKMTYGQIIKKSKRGFILSSPSVPGCSGGPLLTLEGDKLAVAGQLFGHESIFTIPEFKESLDLDYIRKILMN